MPSAISDFKPLLSKGYQQASSKKLLVTKSIATRSKDATRGAPGPTTSSNKLLGAKGIGTRNKDATRGSWPYY